MAVEIQFLWLGPLSAFRAETFFHDLDFFSLGHSVEFFLGVESAWVNEFHPEAVVVCDFGVGWLVFHNASTHIYIPKTRQQENTTKFHSLRLIYSVKGYFAHRADKTPYPLFH